MKTGRGKSLVRAMLLLLLGGVVAPVREAAAQKSRWEGLSPRERYDAMRKYQEYEQLPQERKEDIDQRYERWRRMPPQQRQRVLRNFERYQQMPPQERERLQRRFERWKSEGDPPKRRPKKLESNH